MKETKKGLKFLLEALVGLVLAIIVTIVLKAVGLVYGFGWIVYHINQPKRVIKFIDTWIGGIFQNIAWFIMKFSLFLDFLWNIGGSAELLEDFSTSREDSLFNTPRVSISASIGEAEQLDDTTIHVRGFSRGLNVIFREVTHCLSSYRKYINSREFNKKEFNNEDRLL